MRSIFACNLLLAASLAMAQSAPNANIDPALWQKIANMPAFDNHAHIQTVAPPGEEDHGFDALPCPPGGASTLVADSHINLMYLDAWHALYGYPFRDASPEHLKTLFRERAAAQKREGDGYPSWVLNQMGIAQINANRIAMGPGLSASRFHWVPYDDSLLFPLNNRALENVNPDRAYFFPREEHIFRGYLQQAGLSRIPATLADYVAKVIVPTLESQKQHGAVAIKFEAAYLRSLQFRPASEEDAARIYAKYAAGTVPDSREYRRLQDFLFRTIAREAGRVGLAVHIHTGNGCGAYYNLQGGHAELLTSVFDDPTLNKTNFVILHGGEPFTEEIVALITKPNVYVDFSTIDVGSSPRELSRVLRRWIESMPDKILFGTDMYPGGPDDSWEETGWVATHSAREALAMALTGLVRDGIITRARALEIARGILYNNAARLYGLAPAK